MERLNYLICSPEERILKSKNLTEKNEKNILKYKNRFVGERCFIVGGSPSLSLLDLTKLKNEFTFTVNRGYMLQEKGLEHSAFHIISDVNTFNDVGSKSELLDKYTENLFCYAGMHSPKVKCSIYYFDYIRYQLANDVCFQSDLLKPLIAYESVVHYAIQIAYYMGFKNIYLLGVDLDFKNNIGHFYNETDGEKQRQFEHSIKMSSIMLMGIEKCDKFLKSQNVNLMNASPLGIVDCISRVDYKDLF